jgi:transposase
MTNRGDVSDTQWVRLQPLLPPQKPPVGKPGHDHRRILNGILWKLRTGAPWRDLPARYGPWSTVASRCRRWRLAGVWDRVFAAVQQEEDQAGRVDWDLQSVDATIVRAHQHAAGAKGTNAAREALGRSQGGVSTKVHLKSEGGGKVLSVILTPGQAHEAPVFDRLLGQGAIKRPGRGRPRHRPGRVLGDKGYSSRHIRALCRRRGIRYTIPRRTNECRTGSFDRALYRLRHKVECAINRCKQFRSLATRYEKRAESYRALWVIALTILWL